MQKCNQKTPRKKAAQNERRKATSTTAAAGSSGREKMERKGGRGEGKAGREEEAQASCKRCTILAPQVLIKCCSQVSVTHADIALEVGKGGRGRRNGAAADTHILRQHLRIQCENELQPNVAR